MSEMADLRRTRIAGLVDLPRGVGLEIGPLADPLVLQGEHDVRYVDITDQAGLRAHYAADPSVDCSAIPEIDFTLEGPDGFRTLGQAVAEAAPFAYVVACHVIEHVPDVVGWLSDLASITVDDAPVVLVVPDRRYCFDLYRRPTTVGQMLQAHAEGDTRPSLRAVYDHFSAAVVVSPADAWAGEVPAPTETIYQPSDVDAQVQRTRDGHYVDCHVWVFTPAGFVAQLGELARLGLCDFSVEGMLPTPPNNLEFYVVLRRQPRGLAAPERHARATAALARLALPEETDEVEGRIAAQRLTAYTEQETPAVLARLAAERADADALRARLHAVEGELAEVRGSERWRAGGLLVGPVAATRRAVGRLRHSLRSR